MLDEWVLGIGSDYGFSEGASDPPPLVPPARGGKI